jgi:hypothetical protein
MNDRINKSSFARTEYFLLRDYHQIDEILNSRTYVNQANVNMQLNTNRDKLYLNNTLKFEGGWDNERGNAVTKADNISQHLEKPSYGVNNSFEMIKKFSGTSIRVTSYNSYSTLPHSLTVRPVLYEDLFDVSGDFQAMRQEVTTNRFASSTNISGGHSKGNLHQNYDLSFRADLRHLDSDLTLEPQNAGNSSGVKAMFDSLQNNLQWNKLEWIFSPQYTYNYNEWRINIKLPLKRVFCTIT